MKNSTPLAGWSFWAWGICPKRRGGYPSAPMKGWSFPPLSMKAAGIAIDSEHFRKVANEQSLSKPRWEQISPID
ncbi:MAG: hypothetical protein RMZ41_012075 [Nostoc sp. DedVER02]|uniref:hypothetical protein n=1 Tax=unclassified Nostoc TaxID=2593658 RepID=UPI002AD2F110|nr:MULTISPECIES: hypothetical protein [unclassified Nostoc]MDZ7985025.1 hypothetical protein [Nostoc sp. DedVER02]MDZ8114087.1 hypothetical protein [Nostoc sp. DedVER01b]